RHLQRPGGFLRRRRREARRRKECSKKDEKEQSTSAHQYLHDSRLPNGTGGASPSPTTEWPSAVCRPQSRLCSRREESPEDPEGRSLAPRELSVSSATVTVAGRGRRRLLRRGRRWLSCRRSRLPRGSRRRP